MRHHTCTACQTRIPTGMAVLRGNGHELLAWHPTCWTGGVAIRASRPTLAEPSNPVTIQRRVLAA